MLNPFLRNVSVENMALTIQSHYQQWDAAALEYIENRLNRDVPFDDTVEEVKDSLDWHIIQMLPRRQNLLTRVRGTKKSSKVRLVVLARSRALLMLTVGGYSVLLDAVRSSLLFNRTHVSRVRAMRHIRPSLVVLVLMHGHLPKVA